jgi:DNA-binding CsgD family transcriptional regulator
MGQKIMEALDSLVPSDVASIITAVPGGDWQVVGEISDNRLIQANFWRYTAEFEADEALRMTHGFVRDADVFSTKRRDRLAIFREFLVPNGAERVVHQSWCVDGRLWGVGICRSGGFADRELAHLRAIDPHLRAALRSRTWPPQTQRDGSNECNGAHWGLTPAQERTMFLAIRGLTNKEIAGLLGSSPNTVRNTLVEVFGKVGVSRRSELAFIVQSESGGSAQERLDMLRETRHQYLSAVISAAADRYPPPGRTEEVGPVPVRPSGR